MNGGIQVANKDYEGSNCKFSIDTPEASPWINYKNKDLYPLLKAITDTTTVDDLIAMKNGKYADVLSDYSIDESLLDSMIRLSNVIKTYESTNDLTYILEKTETGEQYSCNRVYTGPENRYAMFDNTYVCSAFIGPGTHNVFLNGVLLDRSTYSVFDNKNIILNDLSVAGGSDEYDKDDKSTWNLIKYYDDDSGEVKKVYTKTPDELLIELRTDTTVKKASYEIKEVSYDTQAFDNLDYDFPQSLLNTKDTIKIYIDGILYTGGYTLKNNVITLLEAPLSIDPIKLYFNAHPDTYNDWKKINGEYTYRKSRVIFEWR